MLFNTCIAVIASRSNIESKNVNGISNRGLPPNAVRNDEDGASKVR
jgi:hypothetical protein